MIDGYLKKWIKLIMIIFLCTGCSVKQPEIVESKEPFTVQLFYSQTCPRCKSLKEHFIPRLETEFGDQMTFVEHDIDLQESIDLFYEYSGLYDWQLQEWTIEGKLVGVPIDMLCNEDKTDCSITWIPFVIVGDMYAFFGYDNDYLEDYVTDVHLALQGKELSDSILRDWRFLIKNEEMD